MSHISAPTEELLVSSTSLDEPLDDDLEAIDSSRSQVEGTWKRPSVYVLAFEAMINTVTEAETHLLSAGELRVIEALRCLSYNARYCLFRLILRKSDTWHTVASMKGYEKEVRQDCLLEAIDELCMPLEEIIASNPLSQPSQQSGSQESQPPTSSSQTSGPEVIDLTMDSDDEAVAPPMSNAEAGPSRISTSSSPAQRAQVDLKPSLDSLRNPEWNSDFNFLCEDDTNMTMDEALNKLTGDQLREIVREMKVKPAKLTKPVMISALRSHAMTQSILNFNQKGKGKARDNRASSDGSRQTILPFTQQKRRANGCCQSQERRLMDMALQRLGRSVRVNTDLYWLVVRLNVIYERSMEYPKSFLVPSLLTSFKKRAYPEYTYVRDPTIWATRQAFLDYVEALRLEAALEKELDTRLDKENLKTPIPGNNKLVTPSVTVPRHTATPLKTPFSPSSQSCKKEEDPDIDLNAEENLDLEKETSARDIKEQRARRIKALFDESICPRWKELVTASAEQPAEARTPGLERFEPGYVYTRMFSRVLESLATLKAYSEELVVLEALLAQRFWRRGKRAKWHERRAILLTRYLGWHENGDGKKKRLIDVFHRAYSGLKEALKDEDTGIVFRPGFVHRLRKLEKLLKIPPEDCCQCEGELKKAPIVFCGAIRLLTSSASLKLDANGRPLQDNASDNPSVTKYFAPVDSKTKHGAKADKENIPQHGSPSDKWKWKGKSLWRGRNGEEVNVESRALEFYESKGFKGFHSETRVVTTIFALLFWDIIFSEVPGAFETPYQIAPLDLSADSFYRARKDAIETRLEELKIPGRAAEILAERDAQHRERNTWCIGVRWDICAREDLVEIVLCLGGDPLAIICRLLCEDYSGRSSGVPDLIVWNFEKKLCKFVEVKGPGDRPAENQKLWFDTLIGAGAEIEICRVYDINKPPPAKGIKKQRRKRSEKHASVVEPVPQKSGDGDSDLESEEEPDMNQSKDSDDEYWSSMPEIGATSERNARKRRRSPSLSDLVPSLGPVQLSPSPSQRQDSLIASTKKRKSL